ncbi:NB-ARC domain-containing protein [Streptomyces sp. NBC_01549]|uniref:NB-ARC domain-containing protein n=1 Tax=Streptomyces sp. NBC_01549 TaxID=2975874 RepID=UPI002257F79D|nr:NB-ARC domain-containing protein [Streptomyces sp. NBC_01549]MCX4598455.1 NB-ARC domain-containing protein [Streptomyces sp. NBC_01549]
MLAGICGLLGALLGLAANAATGDEKWPGLLDQVRAHAWPVTGVLGGAMVVLGVLAVVIERRPEPAVRNDPRPPSPPQVPDHFVPREQSREVVAAVCARAGQVGITTSLRGSGGFGKTLLAQHVCGQRQVQRHFRKRVYFVTVGRDIRSRAEIAAKVGEAVTLITGNTSTPATDPDAAGAHLGRLLDERPRTLLVLDDVWEERQLAPFLIGGPRCARLITTRNTTLLPAGAAQVHVDQMTPEQAEQSSPGTCLGCPVGWSPDYCRRPAGGRCFCAWPTGSSSVMPVPARMLTRRPKNCCSSCGSGAPWPLTARQAPGTWTIAIYAIRLSKHPWKHPPHSCSRKPPNASPSWGSSLRTNRSRSPWRQRFGRPLAA